MSDILVMTQVVFPAARAAGGTATAGALFAWAAAQPGFVWGDVLADLKAPGTIWLTERWSARALRDAARLDPAGAEHLRRMESLAEKDDSATYVPIDRFPHGKPPALVPGAAFVRAGNASPLVATPGKNAPTVQIGRFHLKPGRHDAFVAADRAHGDSLDSAGVIDLDVARHSDNPNRFCHYEIWPTSKAHQAYADSYERQRFLGDAGPLLVEPEPSEELILLARYLPAEAGRAVDDGLLVPPVDHASLSPEARKVMDAAPPVAFFDLLGHAQVALKSQVELMMALMAKDIALAQRHRMLAALLVLVTGDVAYEWNRQLEPALAAGVIQDEVDAIVNGWRGSPLFGSDDRLVLRATAEVLALGRVTPGTMHRLVDELGAASTVELLLNVGHFRSMGQLIVSARLPPAPKPDEADDRHNNAG